MYSRRHIPSSGYLLNVALNKEEGVQPLHYEGAKAKLILRFSSPRAECADSRERPGTGVMGEFTPAVAPLPASGREPTRRHHGPSLRRRWWVHGE